MSHDEFVLDNCPEQFDLSWLQQTCLIFWMRNKASRFPHPSNFTYLLACHKPSLFHTTFYSYCTFNFTLAPKCNIFSWTLWLRGYSGWSEELQIILTQETASTKLLQIIKFLWHHLENSACFGSASSSWGYIIPTEIVRHFLDDYNEFLELQIGFASTSHHLRRWWDARQAAQLKTDSLSKERFLHGFWISGHPHAGTSEWYY